jgi:hypothetical protein
MADEGFLQRWSRRKAEARGPVRERDAAQDAVPEREPAPETADPPAAAAPGDVRTRDDEVAVDLEALPDIETLTYESDFTVFMRKGVPADLRRRALQRLWRSHPTLANLDGLLEYGEDYTRIGTTQQVVRTAYQVGRGMLGRLEAPAEGAEPASSGRAESTLAEPLPSAPLPAPEGPDDEQPTGGAPRETGAIMADREEARPPADEHVRSAGPRPRPLPRRRG